MISSRESRPAGEENHRRLRLVLGALPRPGRRSQSRTLRVSRAAIFSDSASPTRTSCLNFNASPPRLYLLNQRYLLLMPIPKAGKVPEKQRRCDKEGQQRPQRELQPASFSWCFQPLTNVLGRSLCAARRTAGLPVWSAFSLGARSSPESIRSSGLAGQGNLTPTDCVDSTRRGSQAWQAPPMYSIVTRHRSSLSWPTLIFEPFRPRYRYRYYHHP